MSRALAMLVALAIGVFTIIMVHGMVVGFFDAFRLTTQTWYWVAMVSTPFLVLALLGITTIGPWIAGLVLTAALWGCFVYTHPRRDAAIGIYILIGVSPIIISAACLLTAWIAAKWSKA
jgi:hypothetical protein